MFERGVVVVEPAGRDVGIVRLVGEHDLFTIAEIRETLAAVAADGLVVDLSRVEFMDAAVVGVLMEAADERATSGRKLVLRVGAGTESRFVGRVLELCGIGERLPIVESDEEALRLAR